MKKSLQITGVRTLFNVNAKLTKPFVVFEVAGYEDVLRNPKQALTDLQNSGRALSINPKEFDRGVENLSGATKEVFIKALLATQGATLTGDIIEVKAGSPYVITGNHPALVDKNHEFYGKVKDGGTLIAEKDGIRVEGFLSIPLTNNELMRSEIAKESALMFASMFGLTQAPQVAQQDYKTVETVEEEETKETPVIIEAIGGKKK